MKKYFSIAVTAMAILGLGSLASCQDEDFDVSTAVLKERAFEQNFIKEFGKPSPNQSWDFYAQMMQSLGQGVGVTRATMDDPIVDPTIGQSEVTSWLTDFTEDIKTNILKNGRNNASAGQNNFSLVSTGEFNIYAVHYGGAIEHNRDNAFHFGLGYYDANNDTTEIKIFDGYYEGTSDQVNPGYGAKINLAPGTKFYFYIDYKLNHDQYRWRPGTQQGTWRYVDAEEETYTRKYYTNENPSARVHITHRWSNAGDNPDLQDNITTDTYLDYPGAAQLLYSLENDGKRYMIIGFEDAWHYEGCTHDNSNIPDYDYNDIIFVLEGALPEPTSKRFFCEDLQSFDWDYNDVVFDVTSRGVILRAVGGTLPVWLEIEDKSGETTRYGELHELMWSLQSDEEKRKHPKVKIDGTEYYKPIRVGANPGLAIEAVQLGPVWNFEDMDPNHTFDGEGLALTDEQVMYFANPKAPTGKKIGSVKLIVGTVDGKEPIVTEEGQTVVKDGSFTEISPYQGVAPAIWSAASSVAWMNEMVKITEGYPGFYGNGTTSDPQTGGMPMWWSDVNLDNTYQFTPGVDVDPDRQP